MGSTNTKAYQLASQGAEQWTVVVSDVQMQGRGRYGKTWGSALGGLWLSVILRPEIASQQAGLLQILGATAARAGVLKEAGVEPRLKWPNDLVLNTGKLGGVLVEVKTVQNKLLFAIVGIGVNANQTEELLPEGAASIYTYTGRRVDLQRLLSRIIQELEAKYAILDDSPKLVSEWWDHCVHKLQTVRVEGPLGIVEGLSKGITSNGQLILEIGPGNAVNVNEGTLRIVA